MIAFKEWIKFKPWRRHSLVLFMGCLTYITFGFSLIELNDPLPERQAVVFSAALGIMPLFGWGLLFIIVGLIAGVSSVWPIKSGNWGYPVLTGLASAWSGVYLMGYLLGDATVVNLRLSLNWALNAFLWWSISGLVNPDRRLAPRDGTS